MQPDDWRKMTRGFLCFVFMWLLPLEANGSTASALNHTTTDLPAAVSHITMPTLADVTPGAATAPTVTVTRPAATPTGNGSSRATAATSEAASTMFPSTAARQPTAPQSGPSELSSHVPTQTKTVDQTITPGDQPSRSPATGTPSATAGKPPATTGKPPATTGTSPTTTGTSPTTTGTSPTTTGTSPTTTGGRSSTTTIKATTRSTEAKRKNSKTGGNHGTIVAGLMGGALVLMMVGFLVIYFQKKKVQKQQITTSEWAGPSPFLSGGDNNGNVTLRSSNRISLSSFLPQRLSKRLSLLPEMDEEMQNMTPGTTFETKHQGKMFGDEVGGKDAPDQSRPKENSFAETSNVVQTSPQEAADPRPDESVSEAPTA